MYEMLQVAQHTTTGTCATNGRNEGCVYGSYCTEGCWITAMQVSRTRRCDLGKELSIHMVGVLVSWDVVGTTVEYPAYKKCHMERKHL